MIYGVFGKPRSGKSTFLAMFVSKALRARQIAQLPIIGKFWKRNKFYYDVIFSTASWITNKQRIFSGGSK